MRSVDQIVYETGSSSKIDRKVEKLMNHWTAANLNKLYNYYTTPENRSPVDKLSFQQRAAKFFEDRKAQALRDKNLENMQVLEEGSDVEEQLQSENRPAPWSRSSTALGSGRRASSRERARVEQQPASSPLASAGAQAVEASVSRGSRDKYADKPAIEESGGEESGGEESGGEESDSSSDIVVSGVEDEPNVDEQDAEHPEVELVEVMTRSRSMLKDSKRKSLPSKDRIKILTEFANVIDKKYGANEARVPEFQLRGNGTIQWGQKRNMSFFDAMKKLNDKVKELKKLHSLNKESKERRSRSSRG